MNHFVGASNAVWRGASDFFGAVFPLFFFPQGIRIAEWKI